jgi:hypothetical protein
MYPKNWTTPYGWMRALGENATLSRPQRPPSGELKAKVVLEARRGARPMPELAAE